MDGGVAINKTHSYNQILTYVLAGFTLLTGITGFSLWGIKRRIETRVEGVIAKQFEEPRIQQVVQKVAVARAEKLMAEQIAPEVAKFNTALLAAQSDMVKMQKCAARIQYYQLKGHNTFPNPYNKQILDALNELVAIAIPNPDERSRFITELQGPDSAPQK